MRFIDILEILKAPRLSEQIKYFNFNQELQAKPVKEIQQDICCKCDKLVLKNGYKKEQEGQVFYIMRILFPQEQVSQQEDKQKIRKASAGNKSEELKEWDIIEENDF